ncbi:hypothetical protein CVT26_002578 [Gymnopilus dilepis]|uniref:CBM1 domain-containing protein n=1 Tax=Gymnopilus dilepis TaxID=231916 RepID=A0A409VF33_9AGAR|nr:hypothetical protein CVT26_002578 [Gymnopilus dilepis]
MFKLAPTLAVLFLYTQAALAQTFNLTVQISDNQLTNLKDLGYNLCIAKKVNQNYTVVWSGNQSYLSNNIFEWEESYQVFGTNTFQNGALVNVATNQVDIAFNQTSILSKEGVMEPATGSIAPGPFFVDNQLGDIHIGVNALLGGSFLPIYVSPEVVQSINTLQPITTVMAWFALSQNTSTMFFQSETQGIEVVYDGTTTAIISYSGPDGLGTWADGPLPPDSSSSVSSGPTVSSTHPHPSPSSTSSAIPAGPTQVRFGQCGGTGWTGPTVCAAGTTCQVLNQFFSQCI